MMALGLVFAGIQLVGFFGIFKEKPALFRKYVTFNSIILYVGLSAALAFIAISAGRHQPAVDECESSFFSSGNQTTTAQADTEGQQICNIFTWVILGITGGLWLLLFVLQVSDLPSPRLLTDGAGSRPTSLSSYGAMALLKEQIIQSTSPSIPRTARIRTLC